ncbi:hypothetical protein ACR6C2_39980 [Streptomyces sp. INA 01156]
MHGGVDVWAAATAFDRGTVAEDEARADAERKQVSPSSLCRTGRCSLWSATPSEWRHPTRTEEERGTAG